MNATEPSISYLHISFSLSFTKHPSHKKYLVKLKKKKTNKTTKMEAHAPEGKIHMQHSLWNLAKWGMHGEGLP